MIKDNLKNLGYFLVIFGIIAFFMRSSYLECSSETNMCRIYKLLGITKKFKYSNVEKCVPSDALVSYTKSLEYDKKKFRRKYLKDYSYKVKQGTKQIYFPVLIFNEEVSGSSLKNFKFETIQGFSSNSIETLCTDVNNHVSFEFKSNPYGHDLFNQWYILIIIGGLFILFGIFL